MSRALRARWLGCFLALLPVGCIESVAWLPDSSGFLYTTGRSTCTLRLFDVSKNEDRLLVEDTKTATFLPAISADGKRIAVARIVRDKGVPDSLQLIFYDLAGKETGRSKMLRLLRPGPKVDEQKLVACYLYWDHGGNRILVSDMSEDTPLTSVYDVKNDRFKVLEGAFASAFGGTPFRPDGKGFLVAKPAKGRSLRFAFVDWDGVEQPIAMDVKALDKDDDHARREMVILPWLYDSSWKADIARVQRGSFGIQVDTASLTGMPYAVAAAEATLDGDSVVSKHRFAGGDLTLYLLEAENATADKHNRQRIVAVDAKTRKTTVVLDKLAVCVLFPSPDKRKVAVWCSTRDVNGQQEQRLFAVIDQAGKIIAQKSVKE
jgi:hypothetical protein